MPDQVGKNMSTGSVGDKYKRQGHTKGNYGNNPTEPSANRNPSELKP